MIFCNARRARGEAKTPSIAKYCVYLLRHISTRRAYIPLGRCIAPSMGGSGEPNHNGAFSACVANAGHARRSRSPRGTRPAWRKRRNSAPVATTQAQRFLFFLLFLLGAWFSSFCFFMMVSSLKRTTYVQAHLRVSTTSLMSPARPTRKRATPLGLGLTRPPDHPGRGDGAS